MTKVPCILPFRAQYAMDEGKEICCKKCGRLIPDNTLQFDIIQQNSIDECMAEDCVKPEWYDMDCFFKVRRPLSEDHIDGFANLRYSDQMHIRKNIYSDVNGISENAPPQKLTGINPALEREIEVQTNRLFAIYDKLRDNKGQINFIDILNANKQYVPNDPAEILSHLSDVIYFGAMRPCPVCNVGKFVFKNYVYRCTGYDSAWSTCINTDNEPTRIPVNIPKKYRTILKDDFKVNNRILRDAAEFNGDDFKMFTKQPLFGMEFVIGATRMSRDEIEHKILAMGGKVSPSIHEKVAAVISNPNKVNGFAGVVKDAFTHRIQVIPDDYLNEVMENDPIELIIAKDYCKWGTDPYVRMPERKPKWPPYNKNLCRYAQKKLKINQNIDRRENTVLWMDRKYEAVLSLVDISLNKNTYIVLQILDFYEGHSTYTVKETIGRLGTDVDTTNSSDYNTAAEAQVEFEKIYLEKTGNRFDTPYFTKMPGLFNHVNIDEKTLANVNRNKSPTKLSQPLYNLMELLYSNDKVIKSTLVAFCFDLDSLPLGKLTKLQIENALNLLCDTSLMINSTNPNKIIAASNQFYSCIPHNFGARRPPVIDTCEMIQEKIDFLQRLLEQDLNFESLISESNTDKNLFDLCYDQLQASVKITMLDKLSEMYVEICDYVTNTQLFEDAKPQFYPGLLKVEEIFEVSRHEEVVRYAPYENHIHRLLLFHGTAVQNLVSILTNGLKIAAPEAKFTGSAFGKGIYFSDSATKSSAYCRSNNGMLLVLLCEAAVGMIDVRYKFDSSKLRDDCESVQAIGQFYPHPVHTRPDGLKIPNGKLVRRNENTDGLTFNEFVVSDEARVKIRYLVKLKTKNENRG